MYKPHSEYLRVYGFIPSPDVAIRDNEPVDVLDRLKSSFSDSLCQELGMDSMQKVDCDPVIKSGVTMHLYKKSN